MNTTTFTPAPITAPLLALDQKIREEGAMEREFGEGDADVLSGMTTVQDRVKVDLTEFDAIEQAIQTDMNLSEAGKQKRMIEAVAACYAKLQYLAKAATDRENAAADLRRALDAIPKASNEPVVDYLMCAEIRRELKSMTQPQRMQVFLEAMARGNTAILRAIQSDPLPGELLPADFQKRIIDESIQSNKPTEWRRLQTLIFVAERLRTLANAVAFTMAGYGQVPQFPTPPTRKSDLKQQNPLQDPPKSRADAPPAGVSSFQ